MKKTSQSTTMDSSVSTITMTSHHSLVNISILSILIGAVLFLSLNPLNSNSSLFSFQSLHCPLPSNPKNSTFITPKDELEEALSKASMGTNKTVIIAVVNKAYVEGEVAVPNMLDLFLEGFWAGEGTRELLNHLIIVAIDQTAYERCLFRGLHCYRLVTDGVDFMGEKVFMSDDFIKMMWRRTLFLLQVLQKGYNFIFTDTDVLWLRNPFTILTTNKTSHLDIQFSTDSYKGGPSSIESPINTGFYFVKSNKKTISLFDKWYGLKDNSSGLKEQDVLQNMISEARRREEKKMPPRTRKAGPGPKKTARATKSQPKAQPPVEDEVKEDVKENVDLSANDNINNDNGNNNKNKGLADLNIEPKSEANGSLPLKKEDEVKEHEYEKDERLDLEDNEPEYEPEEYGGDYDEKEGDQEDLQEEGEEDVEEPEEGDLVEEEEGDLGEEDVEDVQEELEGEEDDEHAGAGEGHEHEHGEFIDAAEEQEHHDVVKERRKRKEFEVFVGGLVKDATEEDLKEVFSAVGEVTEVRLMMNPQTKKNKGFAFLRFATVDQAKRAVTELKNPVVKGKQCGVTPSQDSDTLFLGNICKTWTKEKLKEKLKLYGIENIDDLTLVEDSNNEGKNRGFAFLEFSSRSDAMDAFKRLQKRDVLLGVERPAKVSFADSFIDPGDEIMAQVKTVFIDGLPASWDEDRVRDLLKKFGEIEKVELARNMPSARRKDFGFVTFDSHDAAVRCAKSINNTELGEGDHKAKVRSRLSRPLQRGKGKSHSRGDYRGGRGAGRRPRAPWNRPLPRPIPSRVRGFGGRIPAAADRGLKRPVGVRERRPPPPMPARARPLPPPPRSYERRAPAPPPKSSMKRDYPRREELPPRSRTAADYGSRLPPERRTSYRDEYAPRAPVYSDVHRSSASRSAARRPYADDGYGPRYERPPTSYREGRARDYDSISGSKRSYSALDDAPSRYADPGVRHSRARLDYDMPGGTSQYDTYSDRMGRSTVGYSSSSSRGSMSAPDSHGLYSSRQGMGYSGSYGSSDVGGMYSSSSFGGEYASRGSDVGGSSYSSLYSSRGVGGSSYMGSGSSGSYY